ncbi:molybdenum cofactor biosynthesis protein A [Coriobacteriaceae bacterium CHKCI002]|nr:molybdenum cofactor biosynthesis protein A [Coriobacteriaceae bacterium CHKCI002]
MKILRHSSLPQRNILSFKTVFKREENKSVQTLGERPLPTTLKRSKYTVSKLFNDGTVLLYNLASDAVVLGNREDELETLLENPSNDVSSADIKHAADLFREGFLLDPNEDEDLKLAVVRETALYDTGNEIKIAINPTLSCNARCEYCFEEGFRRGNMSERVIHSTARYIAEAVRKNDLVTFRWFGGEPLMAPDVITDIIRLSHEYAQVPFRHKSTVLSNGSLVTDQIIELFKDNWNVSELHLTLDGDRGYHNRMKHYLDSSIDGFEAVLRSARKALEANIAVVCRINITKDNIDDIDFIASEFDAMPNRDLLRIYPAPVRAHTDVSEPYCFSYDEYSDAYLRAMIVLRAHGYFAHIEDFMPKRKVTCCSTRATDEIVIDQDGRLYKCMQTACRNQCSVGNVERGLILNEELAKWVTPTTPDDCSDCIYMPICQGGCKGFRSLNDPRISPCVNERYYLDAILDLVHLIAVKE